MKLQFWQVVLQDFRPHVSTCISDGLDITIPSERNLMLPFQIKLNFIKLAAERINHCAVNSMTKKLYYSLNSDSSDE